ncbi:RHS repeat protein [Pseudoflavitalea sp. G-6-1-2]|uniref:RHS repeat protein n=1 Tax=Pseudoflavitalea sp. G-6-1-2 TaxID=2728841 RepID=UPI00146B87DB|nr:RHS repeat protein [Pseudoflavitalea sp. G-6-1-2]NML23422.1 RHS repeat protein [Pseudoflavitalea sp. G-6-1-2]
MKRILFYVIAAVVAGTSCSKKNDHSTNPNLLTGIQYNHQLVEIEYDKNDRPVKCHFRRRELNVLEPAHSTAVLIWDKDKLARVEYLGRQPGTSNFVLGNTAYFTYDGNGRIIERKMSNSVSSAGQMAYFKYNEKGRLSRVDVTLGSYYGFSIFNYDAQGNITKLNYSDGASSGTYNYEYDTKKNVLSENNLGELLYSIEVLPSIMGEPAIYLSKNNPVKFTEVTVNDNVRVESTTDFTNQFEPNGKLSAYTINKKEMRYRNDMLQYTEVGSGEGKYFFNKYQ